MTTIKFTTYSTPVGQPRPRATVRPGAKFASIHAQTHIGKGKDRREHPILQFRHSVNQDARTAMAGREPHCGPVTAIISCYFPRLKSDTTKRGPNERKPHTKKPDGDNVLKAVLDSCCGIIFRDDAQVHDSRVVKIVGKPEESPRVEVHFVLEDSA